MHTWIRCCNCGKQSHTESKGGSISFDTKPCDRCGSKTVDAVIGGPKPDWWVDEKEHEE